MSSPSPLKWWVLPHRETSPWHFRGGIVIGKAFSNNGNRTRLPNEAVLVEGLLLDVQGPRLNSQRPHDSEVDAILVQRYRIVVVVFGVGDVIVERGLRRQPVLGGAVAKLSRATRMRADRGNGRHVLPSLYHPTDGTLTSNVLIINWMYCNTMWITISKWMP